MSSIPIEHEIMSEVARLGTDEQRRVLEFARSLAGQPTLGMSGSRLLKFAGWIPASELDEMRAAIEEGCERVDPNGW